ncbi:Autoinducer 2 import system permease protein LsrD [Variovorax sp. PBS-H4]|nr:Autoinducer 2 import system permease protein LsrD [Variovorax sp. PBS-H4]
MLVKTNVAPELEKQRRRWTLPSLGEFGAIWFALGILVLLSAWLAPETLRPGALAAMAPFASFLALVSVGQMLVIRQRGLDMSAGTMMTLAGLVLAGLAGRLDSIWIPLVLTLCVAALVGVINGLLVSKVHISPIVATLAVDALLLGGVRAISGGTAVTMPKGFQQLTHTDVLGLPSSLVVSLASIAAVAVAVNFTLHGRNFIAVGASPRAAAGSGLRVVFYQVGGYVLASICFGLAGMMLAGFVGSASQTAGADYLLPGIVAVIVGGTQFSGGKGSIVATALAAIFMAQLQQLVLSLGASPALQLLIQAAAIVIAVGLRSIPRLYRRLGASVRLPCA